MAGLAQATDPTYATYDACEAEVLMLLLHLRERHRGCAARASEFECDRINVIDM
jgi:hypothetical protein